MEKNEESKSEDNNQEDNKETHIKKQKDEFIESDLLKIYVNKEIKLFVNSFLEIIKGQREEKEFMKECLRKYISYLKESNEYDSNFFDFQFIIKGILEALEMIENGSSPESIRLKEKREFLVFFNLIFSLY